MTTSDRLRSGVVGLPLRLKRVQVAVRTEEAAVIPNRRLPRIHPAKTITATAEGIDTTANGPTSIPDIPGTDRQTGILLLRPSYHVSD